MNFIKNVLFTVFVLIPALPLFVYLIWNDKMQEFADLIKTEMK